MAKSFNQQPNEKDTELDSRDRVPLGIKNPLLPPNCLGQTTLQMQIISPLRASSLTSLNRNLKNTSEVIQRKNSDKLKGKPTNLPKSRIENKNVDATTNNKQDIPTAWTSLADLIEKNTVAESSMPIQRSSQAKTSSDIPENLVFTPEGFQIDRKPAKTSSDNQSANSLIQPKHDRNIKHNSPLNKNLIQTKKMDSSLENFADITSGNNSYNEDYFPDNQLNLNQENSVKEEDSKNFDRLAREIYNLLRQRLQIERERHGRSSSSRLSW